MKWWSLYCLHQWLSLSYLFSSNSEFSFNQFETDSTHGTTFSAWWLWSWIKILKMATFLKVGSMWIFLWETQIMWETNQTSATNVSMHPLWKAAWKVILKSTAKKSQTSATNVTLPFLGQAIWWDILKYTVEKSQIIAINATMHALKWALWEDI